MDRLVCQVLSGRAKSGGAVRGLPRFTSCRLGIGGRPLFLNTQMLTRTALAKERHAQNTHLAFRDAQARLRVTQYSTLRVP